ncbi:MAG: RecBCD enzyme subunit RecC [Syntrophus sp. PtaU1.Bin208]|nr:MAG: RecBCD enzyme subunit RecC [Syntrophus sp. PtaU1.Bin208]
MHGLNLFVSNRMEILAEKLADVLESPLALPLAEELIVVQSRGMERWISMQLSASHGICANVRFPFPRNCIAKLFQTLLPEEQATHYFDPEAAAWRIFHLLPSCSSHPGFEPLGAYLSDDPQGLKRCQLSRKIAQLYDSYLIFRPEMVLDWERGILREEGEFWQGELWRRFNGENRIAHPAALRSAFFEALRKNSQNINGLPERLSLFGISYLPPFYLDIFLAVSSFLEVNLFLLNPSREFWFDIRSSREISREMKRVKNAADRVVGETKSTEHSLYLEEGNSLLASLGTLGREFWSFLSEASGREEELYADPGEDFLLAAIQSDILNLRERGGEGEPAVRTAIRAADASLSFHACHSPLREVEVLHDSLLALLDADPSLMPSDIGVMAPDIEPYAPFISAVFDSEARGIPYHIADRSPIVESPIVQGFLAILDLSRGRFVAGEVLALLEVAAIRSRFGLTEQDLDRISAWVTESGIRWGIDGKSRLQEGLPDISANSWRWGLERLLLGYALPAREKELFSGILPFEPGEGSEVSILGILASFTEQLFSTTERLVSDRSLAEWGGVFVEIVDRFFSKNAIFEPAVPLLRQACLDLKTLADKSSLTDKISLDVVRAFFEERLRISGTDSGFLSRGITFCSLLPMRSIPFKVLCLLGMNNADYPRRPQTPGFDLMARHPRRGDRSRRNDDRHLFLETLLSARESLYISYVGQSMEDNSRIPPSPVVSELLDYIRQGFSLEGVPDPAEFLVTFHPLQAFDPVCFSGESPRLFSFSGENCRAAIALRNRIPEGSASEGDSDGIPADPEREGQVTVRDLIAFFRHPARYFLERRLGVTLAEGDVEQEENEPFELAGLDRYCLEQRLLEHEIETGDLDELYPALAASGRLPHGSVGQFSLQGVSRDIRTFVRHYSAVLREKPLASPDLDLEVGGTRISGQLEGLRPRGLVHYRYSRIKAKDRLKLWINHLLLQATTGSEGQWPESLLLGKDEKGKDGSWTLIAVEDARARLEGLLNLFREGLRRPLHFFPEASWTFAGRINKNSRPSPAEEEAALDAARTVWEGSDFQPGEGDNGYNHLLFGDSDPLDREFRDLSMAVFGPLLGAQRKNKED